MESFGLYLLKSAVWLTGFALVFLVVLRNERYFQLNRIYLLSGIVASIVFPFYTWHYAVILPSFPDAEVSVSGLSAVAVMPEKVTIPIYWWFYLAGTVYLVFRLIRQTWMVIRKLQKAGYVKNGSVKLVRTSEYAASFSFFSFVFVNPSTTDIEMKEIVNHEREHIQQRHWFDLLLVELLCMLQWFNPFIWIYSHLIRQNHEYLADERALQSTSNPAIYQATLLNQMFGAPVISLANSFSYSLNKKRFKMMKKTIDSPFRKLKMLLVLPLVAMVFYAFAKPEYISTPSDNQLTNVSQSTEGKIVKGKVIRENDGKALPGTSVIIVASTIGTITDTDGSFELGGVSNDAEIAFSFVGMKSLKVKPDFGKPMIIKMVSESIGIDKVVVVGYGTPPPPPPPPLPSFDTINPPLYIVDGVITEKRKAEYFLSVGVDKVSVLKGKGATDKYGEKGKNGVIEISLKKNSIPPPPPPPLTYMAKKAGFNGENPPLIFLDGVIIEKSKMDAINPNDIESINVLKDKSATDKYGEMAKNGVMEITSKKQGVHFKSAEGLRIAVRNGTNGNPPLYFVDGVEITADQLKAIDSNAIQSVNVWKGDDAVKKFGEKGREGVVDIHLKSTVGSQAVSAGAQKDIAVVGYGKMEKEDDNKEVFVVVEEMPEFPGGDKALRTFIATHIKYPTAAVEAKAVGTVFVNFVVSSNGKIGNAKVIKSIHPALDKEAIRVVNSLPDWKPGKQRGKNVDVVYTMPIEFLLQ
ncbi:MAG: TonB family protein [Mariniphaga sp.]|nr:TonB family protein [Mariniphaga sp.]